MARNVRGGLYPRPSWRAKSPFALEVAESRLALHAKGGHRHAMVRREPLVSRATLTRNRYSLTKSQVSEAGSVLI
jgi:hypothetical protein